MAPGSRKQYRNADRSEACPSVASYLHFYANIPDYSDLHDLSDAEFYERLQALKAAQQQFAAEDRPSSQSSLDSRPQAVCENKPQRPTIVVHSPPSLPWEDHHNDHHHHHHHRDLCRSMGALSVDSSNLHVHGKQFLRPHSRATNRDTKIERKHQVPLLSRIPLFHQIMAEQEERRRIIHERNSQELTALVQPFSFTKKEEAAKQARCCPSHLGVQHKPFRAKPVPRDLFSSRAYDRIHEDQFYRAIKKRIRAEEMLKTAKMPPSMQARQTCSNKEKSKSVDLLTSATGRRQRSRSRGHRRRQQEDTEGRRSTPPHRPPSGWRTSSCTNSSVDASPNDSTLGPRRRVRPTSSHSAARSNLASVLRVQTSRTRLENTLKKQLEEQEFQTQARFKARLLRLSPAWQTLDYSTDEDLALRLAQRRQEARQQGKNHRRLMEAIQGRVHHITPLFQNPTRHSIKDDSKSKSLDSCLDSTGKRRNVTTSKKAHSFYLNRSDIHERDKESKDESCITDSESNEGKEIH